MTAYQLEMMNAAAAAERSASRYLAAGKLDMAEKMKFNAEYFRKAAEGN